MKIRNLQSNVNMEREMCWDIIMVSIGFSHSPFHLPYIAFAVGLIELRVFKKAVSLKVVLYVSVIFYTLHSPVYF